MLIYKYYANDANMVLKICPHKSGGGNYLKDALSPTSFLRSLSLRRQGAGMTGEKGNDMEGRE